MVFLYFRLGLDIADSHVNVEEDVILETLYTEQVEYLGKIDPHYAEIVTLGRQDYSKKQIIAELGLKPSCGYQEINAAKELTKKFLESSQTACPSMLIIRAGSIM